jgi:hypothetical protein
VGKKNDGKQFYSFALLVTLWNAILLERYPHKDFLWLSATSFQVFG